MPIPTLAQSGYHDWFDLKQPTAAELLAVVPDDSADTEECSICKTAFCSDGLPVVYTACPHFFHEECLVPWLEAASTCPLCRHTVTEDATLYTPVPALLMAAFAPRAGPVPHPGCGCQTAAEELAGHAAVCPHTEAKCRRCGWLGPQSAAVRHLFGAHFLCRHDGCITVWSTAAERAKHQRTCWWRIVTCGTCDEQMTSNEFMANHRGRCFMCPHDGCTVTCPTEDALNAHRLECDRHPLRLVADLTGEHYQLLLAAMTHAWATHPALAADDLNDRQPFPVATALQALKLIGYLIRKLPVQRIGGVDQFDHRAIVSCTNPASSFHEDAMRERYPEAALRLLDVALRAGMPALTRDTIIAWLGLPPDAVPETAGYLFWLFADHVPAADAPLEQVLRDTLAAIIDDDTARLRACLTQEVRHYFFEVDDDAGGAAQRRRTDDAVTVDLTGDSQDSE